MMLYKPEPLVVAGVATPVATFVAVTVAPATTAPWESVTVPPILARPLWANKPCAPSKRNNAVNASIVVNLLANCWFSRTFFSNNAIVRYLSAPEDLSMSAETLELFRIRPNQTHAQVRDWELSPSGTKLVFSYDDCQAKNFMVSRQ